MLVEALAAMSLGTCIPLYSPVDRIVIQFNQDSAELSDRDRGEVARLVRPVLGDPLAELRLQGYFPYGARSLGASMETDILRHRLGRVRDVAVELGLPTELIGLRETALGGGGTFEGRPGQLDSVEVEMRVKTSCHPLAEAAAQASPYERIR